MAPLDTRRRRWLQALAAAGAFPFLAARAATTPAAAPWRLALAWSEEAPGAERVQCTGVWQQAGDRFEVAARRVVPTRAHGLAQLPSGELLTVARRPGLWLQRWSPDGQLRREAWAEPGRQFNGHVLPSAAGGVLYSTEQTHDDNAGCVALRDPLTLALRDEWPTGGTDCHEMLRVGDQLFVANGGVPTRPETGRAKLALPTMDSSLVVFDLRTGQRRGPWRLADPRLSLRHLAWHAPSRTLGIALQAEHDDPAQRARTPLLALFDGQVLSTVAPPGDAPAVGAGYAGDIAATPEGFVLSASRAGALLGWSRNSGWAAPVPLAEACALATGAEVSTTCALGAERAWAGRLLELPPGCKPDNHALVL
ncbi:DUF1513 domain-containing protein [Ideonella sp.]|uniref:DUF1513 domain-containing protein n=1 Tax=Ideonella sp. TaxID=1929293 RepID=UPI0035AE3A53